MDDKIIKLMDDISELKLELLKINERISLLEAANVDSGVYIQGSPKYVQDYLSKKRELDATSTKGDV